MNWNTLNLDNIWFPRNFMWGVADSALQTEGIVSAKGQKVPNSWTEFEKTLKDHTPVGVACERWTRFKEDVSLLKKAGFNAWRFSIEWSKIQPTEDTFDELALSHYEEFIDELLSQGIIPMPTLFHHTVPVWFDRKGGFEQKHNGIHFVRYALYVFQRLKKKAHHWVIFNEPIAYAIEGYYRGIYPPGKRNLWLAGTVAKNLLNLHVFISKEFKRFDPESQIGICHIVNYLDPYYSWNIFEKGAAKFFDYLVNDVTFEFFKSGRFSWLPFMGCVNEDAPKSLDFFGINYYTHTTIKQTHVFKIEPYVNPQETVIEKPINGIAKTLYPEGLYRAIVQASTLHIPLYITENGTSIENDELKNEYIKKHLYVISLALRKGYDVRGYFFWTLTDCFGWRKGYTTKHGVYEVDFSTQKRTLRSSCQSLLDVIKKFSR